VRVPSWVSRPPFAFALGMCTAWAIAYLVGPLSKDDCVLRYIKAGMSEAAARSVLNACSRKYSDTWFASSIAPEKQSAPPNQALKWEDLSPWKEPPAAVCQFNGMSDPEKKVVAAQCAKP
jgi:hypothetical protein